jgi:hypothetical protein
MSEPTSSTSLPVPALPSSADATPYVPVSWVAAAAALAAVVFIVTLGVFAGFAFVNKKPLIEPGLLALPAITLVLCFAARRAIRDSEGTRTDLVEGVSLVNVAWWTALVLGLCYAAYLFAIDYAIHREVNNDLRQWMDSVKGGTEDDLIRAYHHTLPPGVRQDIAPNDADTLRRKNSGDFYTFASCDLVRLARRNTDQFKYVTDSVTWAQRSAEGGGAGAVTDTKCDTTGTVECREGVFPISVTLVGQSARGTPGGRQWMVFRPQNGFIEEAKVRRTPYGWLIDILQSNGGGFGRMFVAHSRSPGSQPFAYRGFIAPGGNWAEWAPVAMDPQLAFAFALPTAALGDAGYTDFIQNRFFKLPNGADPNPILKETFLKSWYEFGVRPSGEMLKDQSGNTADKPDAIVTDTAVEVGTPVEIPVIVSDRTDRQASRREVARGRLVVACTDPALMELVKRLKESADPARATAELPADLRAELTERFADPRSPSGLLFPWRVVRVESNLDSFAVSPPSRPGMSGPPGAGGPPGMGPGGPPGGR